MHENDSARIPEIQKNEYYDLKIFSPLFACN